MRVRIGMALAAVAALSLAVILPAQAKPWRNGVVTPKSDAGIVLMVANGGFAATEGLDLEIVNLQNDAAAQKALIAGDVDSYESAPVSAIVAAAHGADVKIVGCSWLTLVHGVFTRPAIKTAKDLEGQTIAVAAPGTMMDVLARAWLAQNGVPADKIRFAGLGGDPDRYKALLAGVVGASVVSIENAPLATPLGLHLLATGREVLPNFLRMCTMVMSGTVAARREDLVRFLTAEMRALRFALSHREAALKVTQAVTAVKPDDPRPAYIFDDAIAHGSIDPRLPIPVAKLAWMQDMLVKTGNIAEPIDIARMVETNPRDAAAKRAGPP